MSNAIHAARGPRPAAPSSAWAWRCRTPTSCAPCSPRCGRSRSPPGWRRGTTATCRRTWAGGRGGRGERGCVWPGGPRGGDTGSRGVGGAAFWQRKQQGWRGVEREGGAARGKPRAAPRAHRLRAAASRPAHAGAVAGDVCRADARAADGGVLLHDARTVGAQPTRAVATAAPYHPSPASPRARARACSAVARGWDPRCSPHLPRPRAARSTSSRSTRRCPSRPPSCCTASCLPACTRCAGARARGRAGVWSWLSVPAGARGRLAAPRPRTTPRRHTHPCPPDRAHAAAAARAVLPV